MSSPSPVAPPPARKPWFGLSRRTLLLIALAFGIGLLLFLVLLADQGNDDEFFRADGTPADRSNQAFEPLPVPDAAGGDRDAIRDPARGDVTAAPGREGADRDFPAPDEAPVIEPIAPAPPPPSAVIAGPDASARPIRSPAPVYPAAAFRRRESGTVLLQVHVDDRGRPERVDVVQSSRSRALDREAVRAVEAWEFSPAVRWGRQVASKVLVPIEFEP